MNALTTAEWDAWLDSQLSLEAARYPAPHLLQSSDWANLKSAYRWSGARVVARKDGEIHAGAQLLFRSLPMGLGTVAYLPKGPITDWQNHELTSYLLAQVLEVARAGRAIFLKLEPDLPDSAENIALLAKYGIQHSARTIQPRQTITLSLKESLDEILARMKQKTRYNIRLSEKKGVSTRIGGLADLDGFLVLMQETATRDGFALHQPSYYRKAYEIFSARGQVALALAEYADKLLAGVMVFTLGQRSWYLYGASSNTERERMPAYAAQWQALQWAKAHGASSYDLYGVPDAPAETLEAEFETRQNGLWSVYRFKRGFGGNLERTVGAFDIVLNPLLYRLYLRFAGRLGLGG